VTLVDVLPDVPSVDRTFVYELSGTTANNAEAKVGSLVRVPFSGRTVDGWIMGFDAPAPNGGVRQVDKVVSLGPSPDIVELAKRAAVRWAGALSFFMKAASPDKRVLALPRPSRLSAHATSTSAVPIVRVHAPGADRMPYLRNMISRGPTLILCPTMVDVHSLVTRLRRADLPVAEFSTQWAQAAAGGSVVVGPRSAAFASIPDLFGIVVLDADDPLYRDERAPTWNAIDVVCQRAKATGVAVELLTSAGSPFMSQWTNDIRSEPGSNSWPRLTVLDLGSQDPRYGILTPDLIDECRNTSSAAVVLNRQGQAQLLRCSSCRELTNCTRCSASMRKLNDSDLTCPVCGDTRPNVCANCGSTALSTIRPGVAKLADDLSAALQARVGEVTAKTSVLPDASVLVGTESVLRRGRAFDVVIFADIDRDLLAPRVDAYQKVVHQVTRAVRAVSRSSDGHVVIQTREPDHPVIRSLVANDVVAASDVERQRRVLLGLPPSCAMARVSGPGANELSSRLTGLLGISVASVEDAVLVRATNSEILAEGLRQAGRPAAKVRVEVDPLL